MTPKEYDQRLNDMVAHGTPRRMARAILADMDDVTKNGRAIPGPVLDEPVGRQEGKGRDGEEEDTDR